MFIRAQRHFFLTGFSLIEVLISIIVIAVGLLGLAKMQALAMSNTQVSGQHALVALQASSLAASMHSNDGYWQVASTAASPAMPPCPATGCSMTKTTITDASNILNTPPSVCTVATPCLPGQVAAMDMQTWMSAMNTQVPSYAANVSCSNSITQPTTCTIAITWVEKSMGMNTTTAATAAAQPSQLQSYYLYVQP